MYTEILLPEPFEESYQPVSAQFSSVSNLLNGDCNFAALNNECNAKGDNDFKNKQKKIRRVCDSTLGQLTSQTSALGSQAIPAPVIFSDLFLLIRDTLPQKWQITDSSAPERDLLNGDFNFAALNNECSAKGDNNFKNKQKKSGNLFPSQLASLVCMPTDYH